MPVPGSSIKSESPDFTPWNSPHLLTNQFQLFDKLIAALNANVPPEKVDVNAEIPKELLQQNINVLSHQMMHSWLALAKSYYPFYQNSDHDKILIELLEQKLNIKATDYESLSVLIKEVFFAQYPRVNNKYQLFIDNIAKVMAKLTAIALSTPFLINDAHKHDKQQFEEAGPSISTCIGPIETILRHMMGLPEMDKSFVLVASSLLLQVKAIKSHFEQITLIQQLEYIKMQNKGLQEQLETNNIENSTAKSQELDQDPQSWQSKEEQIALIKVYQLHKKINQYYTHLTEVLAESPKDKKVGAKLERITAMKSDLEKENILPSKRIETFKKQLNRTKDQLEDHRDPMWTRVLRDCLRILALTFSGIAIYRTLTGQPVNFFKPSHGQCFVEEALHIAMAPGDA